MFPHQGLCIVCLRSSSVLRQPLNGHPARFDIDSAAMSICVYTSPFRTPTKETLVSYPSPTRAPGALALWGVPVVVSRRCVAGLCGVLQCGALWWGCACAAGGWWVCLVWACPRLGWVPCGAWGCFWRGPGVLSACFWCAFGVVVVCDLGYVSVSTRSHASCSAFLPALVGVGPGSPAALFAPGMARGSMR